MNAFRSDRTAGEGSDWEDVAEVVDGCGCKLGRIKEIDALRDNGRAGEFSRREGAAKLEDCVF